MAWNYEKWIEAQAGAIEAGMREFGRRGISDAAVWCIPSAPGAPGRLVLADECPAHLGAVDVVRIGPHGSRVMACPYSHLRSLLWSACRSLPVLPLPADEARPVALGLVVLPGGMLAEGATLHRLGVPSC